VNEGGLEPEARGVTRVVFRVECNAEGAGWLRLTAVDVPGHGRSPARRFL